MESLEITHRLIIHQLKPTTGQEDSPLKTVTNHHHQSTQIKSSVQHQTNFKPTANSPSKTFQEDLKKMTNMTWCFRQKRKRQTNPLSTRFPPMHLISILIEAKRKIPCSLCEHQGEVLFYKKDGNTPLVLAVLRAPTKLPSVMKKDAFHKGCIKRLTYRGHPCNKAVIIFANYRFWSHWPQGCDWKLYLASHWRARARNSPGEFDNSPEGTTFPEGHIATRNPVPGFQSPTFPREHITTRQHTSEHSNGFVSHFMPNQSVQLL